MKKQEAFINDPSGYVKLVLWGNHTDSLNEGATYLFNKVRVKVMNEEKYLNTPKNEDECTISLVANFEENLKPVQNISDAKQITANIIGVTKINSYLCCCSCNKSVSIKGKIACCKNCRIFMFLLKKETFCILNTITTLVLDSNNFIDIDIIKIYKNLLYNYIILYYIKNVSLVF